MNQKEIIKEELVVKKQNIKKGTKIISKFLERISKDSVSQNEKFSYNDEHMQEHHDDWTWSDH